MVVAALFGGQRPFVCLCWRIQGEADELCAKLVIKRYAYACLSEDMDLFVYGCNKIMRNKKGVTFFKKNFCVFALFFVIF